MQQITDTQQQGTLFIPMHWTAQYASQGRMGALVNSVVDPISHQPESKQTPVRIKTYQPAWYGFIISRHPLKFNHPDYLVKVKGNQFYRYELAGETMPESWQSWTKNILCSAPQWQEYMDPAKNKYRAARILDNQLQSVIFIAPNISFPERSWLSSLFEKTEFDKQDRFFALPTI